MKPVLPQQVPLSRASRAEAEARIAASRRAAADPELLAALVDVHEHLQAVTHNVRLLRPRVLWSGTANFDASGVWTWEGHLSSREIEIYIAAGDDTAGGTVTAFAGGRLDVPPVHGPGVFTAAPGAQLKFAATTNAWSLYQTGVTAPVSVTVWGQR